MPAEFFVSPGTKNREAVVAALSGVETPVPTSTGINICSKKEKHSLQKKYPDLEFRYRSVITSLEDQDRTVVEHTPVKRESPTSPQFASVFRNSATTHRYYTQRGSATRFQAIVRERKMRRMKIEQQTVEFRDSNDNPFQAVNDAGKRMTPADFSSDSDSPSEQNVRYDESDQDAQRDIDDLVDSIGAKESAEEPLKDSVEDSVEDSVQDSVQSSVQESAQNSVEDSVKGSVDDSVQESVEESAGAPVEAPDQDSIDDSIKALLDATSEVPSKTTPAKSPSKAKLNQPPRSTRRVLFVQPTSRTYRNRRLHKAEESRSEDEDHFFEARENFEESQKNGETQAETQEQFETAPDYEEEEDEDDDHFTGNQTPTKSTTRNTSEPSPQTPSKTPKSSETSFMTPQQSLPEKSHKSPKSHNESQRSELPQSSEPTPQRRATKRRRVLLDEDDGFEDIETESGNHETEFSRERQAEFFVQSDTEQYSDEEDENGKQKEDNNTHNQAEHNVKVEEEYIANAGDDFADEFAPLHPMRSNLGASTSREKPKQSRSREFFTPSKDRLLLESSLAAKKLAIPLKELFKQLQQMIGHTEASLQTRLSKLELTESLQEIAYNSPVLEEAAVSDVIAKILHKTQKRLGQKTRKRIPFTDLDDMSIKAFVADLDPAARGSYSAYERFADKYTHHDASSVKGRWTKTLAPRTSELELLDAKQNYTPVIERQHLDWLRQTYPALFQS